MRTCTKCGEEKEVSEFYQQRGKPMSWCKPCFNAGNRAAYERNREARVKQQVESLRARKLGMTYAEYEALGVDPGKECAICGAPPDSPRNGTFSNGDKKASKKRLAIDHSHSAGHLRGFLCGHCNRGLGLFDDDPALLRAAAEYLERGVVLQPFGSWRPGSRKAIADGAYQPRPSACTVEGCGGPVHARGLCGMHYRRMEVHGDTADPQPRQRSICSVDDCGQRVHANGYCR